MMYKASVGLSDPWATAALDCTIASGNPKSI